MLFCSEISLTKLSYWHSAFNSLKDSYHCLKVHHFCVFLNMNQRAAPYIQQNMSSYWEKFMLLTYRKDWWEILHSNINTSVPVHYIWVLHGFSLAWMNAMNLLNAYSMEKKKSGKITDFLFFYKRGTVGRWCI